MISKRADYFLDSRNHDFFRVAVISPLVHLGDPMACAKEHAILFKKVYEQGTQYAMGPELGLSGGYSLGDLHLQQVIVEQSLQALAWLIRELAETRMVVTVGMGLVVDGVPVNVEVTFCQHKLLKATIKDHLPNEREFYEERYWSDFLVPEEIKILNQVVPIGDKVILKCTKHPGVMIYNPICEADWAPVPMSGFAALAGATIIGNVSASNITIGKDEFRELLLGATSGRHNSAYLYSSAGFGESTSDHAWDGHTFIYFRGGLKKRGDRYSDHGASVVADIDIPMLLSDRRTQHSFRENIKTWQDVVKQFRIVETGVKLGIDSDPKVYQTIEDPDITRLPFVPISPVQREKRCAEVFSMQKTSLMRRIISLPDQQQKIWLGISGGSDSTHALNIAVAAFDQLGLPRTDIHAITMPGFGTSSGTKTNAVALAEAYGVSIHEQSVTSACELHFKNIGFTVDPALDKQPVVYENVQAWERTYHLLAMAAEHGGFVLGTGDMSEAAIGWCTLFGDFPLHYMINGGVAKTLLLYLIGYARDTVFKDEAKVQEVLQSILDTDISPELQPLVEGKIAQKTESLIGPYVLVDFFLSYMVRFGFKPSRILRLAVHAFKGEYEYKVIKHWLGVFIRRFFAAQYKRNMASDGPKIGLVSVCQRGDWRMPSDASPQAWLEDLENTPDDL